MPIPATPLAKTATASLLYSAAAPLPKPGIFTHQLNSPLPECGRTGANGKKNGNTSGDHSGSHSGNHSATDLAAPQSAQVAAGHRPGFAARSASRRGFNHPLSPVGNPGNISGNKIGNISGNHSGNEAPMRQTRHLEPDTAQSHTTSSLSLPDNTLITSLAATIPATFRQHCSPPPYSSPHDPFPPRKGQGVRSATFVATPPRRNGTRSLTRPRVTIHT